MTIGSRVHEDRIAAWALVAAQGALLGAVALLPRRGDWPTPTPLRLTGLLGQGTGLALGLAAASGLGATLSPLPLPNDVAELHTDGPYAYVRHPIYVGLLLAVGSRAVASGNRYSLLAFTGLAGVLHVKAGFEERHLRERFAGYSAYAARTPRLLPRRPASPTN